MLTNIKYILLTALRDRLFLGLLAGIIAAALISGVLGGTAMVEAERMKLVYAASAARVILAVGLTVFTCFHIRQAFDSKEIDVILSRPISRAQLVFSYWLGFSAVAFLLAFPTIVIIGLHTLPSATGFIGWSLSLILEALLVVAFALFAGLTLKSGVTAVMASLGFYTLSRMMAFFVATTQSNALFASADLTLFARSGMSLLSTLVPRLDFFAKTEWLVYGFKPAMGGGWLTTFPLPQEASLFVLQAVIFIPLLLAAAIADFRRRQF